MEIRPVALPSVSSRPQAALAGPSPSEPSEVVQLQPGTDLKALLAPGLTADQKREVAEFLGTFTGEELARLQKEKLVVGYEQLSPLFGGLYHRDTSFFFPLKSPRVRINTQGSNRKGTGIHEVAHALDRSELKAMVGKLGRLLGLTASHASEIKPEMTGLFQDFQARGTAQLAVKLASSLEDPSQPARGYTRTEFAGMHYFYDYQPARDGKPASMELRLNSNPHQLTRQLDDNEGFLLIGGCVGMGVGAGIAAAVCLPVGLVVAGVAGLSAGLGVLRHVLRRRRLDAWNDFQRRLDLPDGQSVQVTRKGETTRVEFPAELEKTPDWTWSDYALHTQEPWEYYAEGVRVSREDPALLQQQDPNLLGYLMPDQKKPGS